MKKVETKELEKLVGGGWTDILDCVMDMQEVTDIAWLTAVQLCALAEQYPVQQN